MNEFIKYQPLNNIAYILNPKVACTTIQNSLLNGKAENVHDVNNFPEYNNPHVPIFTVVRNPFERAVSAYLDKVVSKKDQVVWSNFVKSIGFKLDYEISFSEYLDILLSHPSLETADKHFRPQYYNMHGVTPSFIGYLEDMGTVKKYLASSGLSIINKIPHKTNTKNKKLEYLTDQNLINKIVKLYSIDFDTYGYSTNPDADFNLRPIIQKQYVPKLYISKHVNICSDHLADIFRDASFICESKDHKVAMKLIELAFHIRPEGPVIAEQYKKLNNSIY